MKDLTNEVKAHPSEEERMQRLLTKTESAQYCQLQTRTIDNWMKRGLIPYYKIGKSVRFGLMTSRRTWTRTAALRVGSK